MSSPLVSVVIPSFNYGHLVSEAVESVLAQSYPNVEVIVVDDGSTDDTRQRLAAYGDQIRYHYQTNAGLSAARNTGIGLAQGELIALLDSDDAFHPRKLELQVAYLQSHAEVGLVGTGMFSDEPIAWSDVDDSWQQRTRPIALADAVLKAHFAPSSVLVRRRCFEKAGLFDTELKSVEDRDQWIRIAAHDRLAMIDLPLTWYRQTPGSMSRNAEKMERFEQIVLAKAFRMPQLAGKTLLKRKAFGLAACSAAYMYHMTNAHKLAATRMVKSFLWWPVPMSPPDLRHHFGRVRLAAAIVRNAAKAT